MRARTLFEAAAAMHHPSKKSNGMARPKRAHFGKDLHSIENQEMLSHEVTLKRHARL
jgi:hypothetical protein